MSRVYWIITYLNHLDSAFVQGSASGVVAVMQRVNSKVERFLVRTLNSSWRAAGKLVLHISTTLNAPWGRCGQPRTT